MGCRWMKCYIINEENATLPAVIQKKRRDVSHEETLSHLHTTLNLLIDQDLMVVSALCFTHPKDHTSFL